MGGDETWVELKLEVMDLTGLRFERVNIVDHKERNKNWFGPITVQLSSLPVP